VIARANPAAAARLRLALYSAVHRYETGADDAPALDSELTAIARDLDRAARAA
jgi:hypothetical protein